MVEDMGEGFRVPIIASARVVGINGVFHSHQGQLLAGRGRGTEGNPQENYPPGSSPLDRHKKASAIRPAQGSVKYERQPCSSKPMRLASCGGGERALPG